MTVRLQITDYSWEEARRRFTNRWHTLLSAGDFNLSLSPEWLNAIAASINVADSLMYSSHIGAKRS